MRGVLAAAVLGAVFLAGAGCGESGGSGTSGTTATATPTATATGTATPTATSTPSVTAADRQVCADTEKLIEDSTKRFGDELAKAVRSGNDQSLIPAFKTLLTEWANGMRTQSGRAQNADLRTALSDFAVALENTANSINSIADLDKLSGLDTPEIRAASDKITRICG